MLIIAHGMVSGQGEQPVHWFYLFVALHLIESVTNQALCGEPPPHASQGFPPAALHPICPDMPDLRAHAQFVDMVSSI